MKILMICDFFSEGQMYQDNLMAKYYSLLGNNVSVLTSTYVDVYDYVEGRDNSKFLESRYIWNDITIIRKKYKLNIFNKVKSFKGVFTVLMDRKPDLIYMHGILFNLNACLKYKKEINPECKIIMDSHGDFSNSASNWLSKNILHGIINKIYLQSYIEYITKIFAVTPSTISFLKELYHVPNDKIELLPLGYDSIEFNAIKNKYSKSELRRKLGINPNETVLITGGRINSRKKTDVLIDSLKLMNNKVMLLIFGEIEEGFHDILKSKSIGLNVIFLGWLDSNKIVKFLYCSDLAVYPLGQSVLWQHSIGAGLPLIVGNRADQNVDYLNKNNNLISLESEDVKPEILARHIDNLINNKKLFTQMKLGAIKTAEEYLDYSVICKRTLNVVN